MPVYTMDVILRSDTSAADDPIEFVQGSWTLNGGWSTITYSDDDANGLGDDNPNTETGDASIITHVNGSSTHPLVGSEVFARYVRSDMGDDSDNFADAVFLGEDETNPYVNGWSYAVAAYPGSGWTMNTGDTYQEGNFHPIDHATGSTWSTEGFVGNTTDVTPPCFTTGMEIRTDRGAVAVEDLEVGDMVWTLDHGYQELKFIGRQRMVALGELAPVLFKRGVIGNTKDLIVSQKHRFHVGSLPKALRDQFGDHADTLLQAVQFCDGVNVRLYPDIKTVEYFHLMFDDHQLLECYSTISESWQPTRKALKQNPEQAAELLAIFPEIVNRRACDPGALVRHEVQLKP